MTRFKRCEYKDCWNTTASTSFSFFNFRKHDLRKWMSACGEEAEKKLSKLSEKNLLTNKFVCQVHFKNEHFTRRLHGFQTKLSHEAIPMEKPNDDASAWNEAPEAFSSDVLSKVLSLGSEVVTSPVNNSLPYVPIKPKPSTSSSLIKLNAITTNNNGVPRSTTLFFPNSLNRTTFLVPSTAKTTTYILSSGSAVNTSPLVLNAPSSCLLSTPIASSTPTMSNYTGVSQICSQSSFSTIYSSNEDNTAGSQYKDTEDHTYNRDKETNATQSQYEPEVIITDIKEEEEQEVRSDESQVNDENSYEDETHMKEEVTNGHLPSEKPYVSSFESKQEASSSSSSSETSSLLTSSSDSALLFPSDIITPLSTSCETNSPLENLTTSTRVSEISSSVNISCLNSPVFSSSLLTPLSSTAVPEMPPPPVITSSIQCVLSASLPSFTLSTHISPCVSSPIIVTSIASTSSTAVTYSSKTSIPLRPLAPCPPTTVISNPLPILPAQPPQTFKVVSLPPNMLVPLTYVPSTLSAPVAIQQNVLGSSYTPKVAIARLPNNKFSNGRRQHGKENEIMCGPECNCDRKSKMKSEKSTCGKKKDGERKQLRKVCRMKYRSCVQCRMRKKREWNERNNPQFVKPAIPYNPKRFPVEPFCNKYSDLLGPYITELIRMQLFKNKKKQMRYTRAQLWFAASIMKGVKKYGYKYLIRVLPLPSELTVQRELKRRQEDPDCKSDLLWFDDLVDQVHDDELGESDRKSADEDDALDKFLENQVRFDPDTGAVSLVNSDGEVVKGKNLVDDEICKEKHQLKSKKAKSPKKRKNPVCNESGVFGEDKIKRKSESFSKDKRKSPSKRSKFSHLWNIPKTISDISKNTPENGISNIISNDHLHNDSISSLSSNPSNTGTCILSDHSFSNHPADLPLRMSDQSNCNQTCLGSTESNHTSYYNPELVFQGYVNPVSSKINKSDGKTAMEFVFKEFASQPNDGVSSQIAYQRSNSELDEEYVDMPLVVTYPEESGPR